MTLFKNKYRIESNRLKNWDYSSNGIYFLTFCSNQRACIFGTVENEEMILNENGAIVEEEILNSIKIRQNWIFHNWKVMPNHVHLLVEINNPVIPKFSYSTRTILPDDTDIELRNLYVSHVEMFSYNIEKPTVETHGNVSLPPKTEGNAKPNNEKTHCNASLPSKTNNNVESPTVETHGNASQSSKTYSNVESHTVETYGNASQPSKTHCNASLPSKTDSNVESHNVDMNNVEAHSNAPLQPKTDKNVAPHNDSVEMHDVETHNYASLQPKIDTNEERHNDNVETHSNASLPNMSNIPTNENQNAKQQLSRRPRSISSFVGGIKGTATLKINELNNQFEGSIWQSKFHDHIVRSYEEFQAIYYYIENNPKNWAEDTFNPINAKK